MTAAQTSGITEQTLYNWLKKGEDPEMYPEHAAFHEAYPKAEATAEDKAIEAIPVPHSPTTVGWR